MSEILLQLQNVSKYYTSGGSVTAGILDVNLTFRRGEFVAVTGESGSGKSTLAHVLGGIIPYENGELYCNGSPTSHYDSIDWERHRRQEIGFISQNYGLLYGNTVFENVLSALLLTGMEKEESEKKAEEILTLVELWDIRTRRAAKLSSGQKQRLSIARALAKPSSILIADEPTGNLDPENSEKIIKLLAEAAKDRLVILITHEFSEAEEYVTRHISLRGGRVVTDAELRPSLNAGSTSKKAAPQSTKKRRLSFMISRLSLSARPTWSLLMCIFFSVAAFTVFAFLGTFIIALDDTNTRVYDDEAFRNGDKRRIAVMRGDSGVFTDEDYDKILKIANVESLDRYGYACDVELHYREGEGYELKYYLNSSGHAASGIEFEEKLYVNLLDNGVFIKTIPLLREGEEFLTAGRLPENVYEVVAREGEYSIGDTFPIYIRDLKNWGVNQHVTFDVTVVGLTGYGDGIYLHDDVGAMMSRSVVTGNLVYYPVYESYMDGQCIIPAFVVSENLIAPDYLIKVRDYDDPTKILHVSKVYDDGKYIYSNLNEGNLFLSNELRLSVIGTHKSTYVNLLGVSEAFFKDSVSAYTESDQIAVSITDYAYTDRVIGKLTDMGYSAISPYQVGSTTQNPTLAEERMQTLIICLAAFIFVILLEIIAARAMFGITFDSYKTMYDIGLGKKTATVSVLLMVLFFTVIGQLTGGIGIAVCNTLGVERIVDLVKFLTFNRVALLSGVHLISSAVIAVMTVRAIRRRIYPKSERSYDLDFSAVSEEASL